MTVLSVCAQHSPILTAIGPDGRLHVTPGHLEQLRAEASVHIGLCSRGPIVGIPVAVVG